MASYLTLDKATHIAKLTELFTAFTANEGEGILLHKHALKVTGLAQVRMHEWSLTPQELEAERATISRWILFLLDLPKEDKDSLNNEILQLFHKSIQKLISQWVTGSTIHEQSIINLYSVKNFLETKISSPNLDSFNFLKE
ncbi:MAG: hypothetical protein L0207_04965 [Chlamydiae bacterium]|nr:hypothetical protein [Chlamydiota bacterium]